MEAHEAAPSAARTLSVPEAADLAGVSPQALRKRLARAGAIRREVVGGRVLARVDAALLAQLYPSARQAGQPPAQQGVPTADRHGTAADVGGAPAVAQLTTQLEQLRHELELERVARARVEGELAASARVEASAQRFADRTEAKLAEARREALSLARALGQVEQERDSARALLAGRRGLWSRITGA